MSAKIKNKLKIVCFYKKSGRILVSNAHLWNNCFILLELSPEREVNSGGYIPRQKASRPI